MMWNAVMPTPFGWLGIASEGDFITRVSFLGAAGAVHEADTPVAREAVSQIASYLKDARHVFDLPCQLQGSAFERKVWSRIAAIPCGATLSYAALAADIASAARPVGGACGRNPVPLIIPCHRVVAARGLGGFNGAADDRPTSLPIKRWLLAHEQ